MQHKYSPTSYRRKPKQNHGFVPRPLGAFIPKITKKAVGRNGRELYRLIMDWENIVGPAWSQTTRPAKMTWKPYGVLHIQVDSGSTALLLKHAELQILDRLNSFFGYKAIHGLKYLQTGHSFSKPKPESKPKTPEPKAPILKELEDFPEGTLKNALASLYQAMYVDDLKKKTL